MMYRKPGVATFKGNNVSREKLRDWEKLYQIF